MIDVNALLDGPRGRRMLLEFVVMSDWQVNPEHHDDLLRAAVFDAAYNLDPGRGTSVVRIGFGGDTAVDPSPITPAEVARRLSSVPLAEITSDLLRRAISAAVGSARYWQEPDGEDVLVRDALVRAELRRVAEHIAQSSHSRWWSSGVERNEQWSVQWEHPQEGFLEQPNREDLQKWRDRELEAEARAAREFQTDPSVRWSGIWWSIPPLTLPRSTRALFDGTPACLWFVEDTGGFERALTRQLYSPTDVRVYEINGPETWVELCRRYPLEVTAQKRHDWYRTTGRIGRWVMPDWSQLAAEYDGVHLTVAGYLSAAGVAIPVDDEIASVIAGWNPDETWWFTDAVRIGDPVLWRFESTFTDQYWLRAG